MNRVNFVFVLLVACIQHHYSSAQGIFMVIHNNTGYDLDSLSFGRHQVGKLKKDSSVYYSGCSELQLQSGVPLLRPYGLISGKNPPHKTIPCSTKSRKAKSGYYEFDVMFYEDQFGYRLYWHPHQSH